MAETQDNDFLERMQRIETLVGEIEKVPDPRVRNNARELVQDLLELHRSALETMVQHVTEHDGNKSLACENGEHLNERGGKEIDTAGGRLAAAIGGEAGGGSVLDSWARDKLLSSVLLLHDLHPWNLRTRAQYALDEAVRPYLRSEGGDAELTRVDSASGEEADASIRIHVNEGPNAARGREEGNGGGGGGCGCGSSAPDDLKEAIQNAIRDWAPDLGEIEIVGITEQPKTQEGLVQLTIAHGTT